MFTISTSDLQVVTSGNHIVKYADDVTMVVPTSNLHSIPAELASIESWAVVNNQCLNKAKTSELVISRR